MKKGIYPGLPIRHGFVGHRENHPGCSGGTRRHVRLGNTQAHGVGVLIPGPEHHPGAGGQAEGGGGLIGEPPLIGETLHGFGYQAGIQTRGFQKTAGKGLLPEVVEHPFGKPLPGGEHPAREPVCDVVPGEKGRFSGIVGGPFILLYPGQLREGKVPRLVPHLLIPPLPAQGFGEPPPGIDGSGVAPDNRRPQDFPRFVQENQAVFLIGNPDHFHPTVGLGFPGTEFLTGLHDVHPPDTRVLFGPARPGSIDPEFHSIGRNR